jgi:hypothetical protein
MIIASVYLQTVLTIP